MQTTHFFSAIYFCAHLRDFFLVPTAWCHSLTQSIPVSSCQVSVRCSGLSAGHDFHSRIPHLQHCDLLAARRLF